MELDDVVVVPGATLPVRFSNDDSTHDEWRKLFLDSRARSLSLSSGAGATPTPFVSPTTTSVQWGVISRHRNTTITLSSSSSSSSSNRFENLSLRRQRHRTLWARQGMGPARMQRLSQQLIAELGQDQDFDWDQDDDGDRDDDANTFARNMNHNVGDTNRNVPQHVPQQVLQQDDRERTVLQQRQQSVNVFRQRHQRQHQDNPQELEDNDPFIGRIGTLVTALYTHEKEDDDDNNEFMHDSNDDNGSMDALIRSRRGGNRRGAYLAVTAIGTARFQIIGYGSKEEEREYSSRGTTVNSSYRQKQSIKHFIIKILNDSSLPLPPVVSGYKRFSMAQEVSLSGDAATATDDIQKVWNGYENRLRGLSIVSSIPFLALSKVWPWRLSQVILEAIQKSKSLSGLLAESSPSPAQKTQIDSLLPTLSVSGFGRGFDSEGNGNMRHMDPVAWSFWLVTNLSLSHDEKIKLLEMHSVVERLLYLQERVRQWSKQEHNTNNFVEAIVCCRNCSVPISSARHIFTMNGAEGTSGNYVNVHGIVHQTITLRQVNEDEVWYQGGPVVQDSWFPGYSWTIMACGICGHHLGWQFRREQVRQSPHGAVCPTEKINRPDIFFGVSAANIEIFYISKAHA